MISFNSKNLWKIFWSVNVLLMLFIIFGKGLLNMIGTWNREEYSHGYLIPLISLWLTYEQRAVLAKLFGRGHWSGVVILVLGLILGLAGEFSTLFIITQYAFLVCILGLYIALFGYQGLKILWFPLAYLVFMIPLPNFLYNNLSSYLQLISSKLGVAFIRLFDISVYLEGNVIDLGSFQLQVVEACSGLRYLFPLSSFGFLCAYFFKAKFWMRLLVFLTTIPITVLMNSFRIGVIGILVDNWGKEQAEGFLHDFEGWVVFIGCLGVLFAEMWILTKLFMKNKQFSEVFVVGYDKDIPSPPIVEQAITFIWGFPRTFWGVVLALILVTPSAMLVESRQDVIPARERFTNFPLTINAWQGVKVNMEQIFIDKLKFDDYIIANFIRDQAKEPVNFYVAYYASQRQGASAHSPKSCIPGDGWRIGDFSQISIPGTKTADGSEYRANRAVISKGSKRQLVYYWFQQRGRIITNEYLVKWYLFVDALTENRTDGALIRLVTNIDENEKVEDIDAMLQNFIRDVSPVLQKYVPN